MEKRSGVLGLLSGMVDSPFYGKLVSECLIAAEEQGYVLVMASEYYEKQESQLLERIREQQVESVILLGGNMDYQAIDERMLSIVNYMAESVPLVVMGKSQGVPYYEVRIDESGAMEQAMEYLVRRLIGTAVEAARGGKPQRLQLMETKLAERESCCRAELG
ncbi:MAG: hypothetical protein Q4C65_08670 [Eubacteriales bacterium]|nr:hypothetical protein [Eubacteriales bacterium]